MTISIIILCFLKLKILRMNEKIYGVKRLMTVKICSPLTIYIINILKYVMGLKIKSKKFTFNPEFTLIRPLTIIIDRNHFNLQSFSPS